MIDFIADCARAGGAILQQHQGRLTDIRVKESHASVVTEADLASERAIFDRLHRDFPEDGLLGEETGFRPGRSRRTWIVDPLDGTSNFVAGLPWFGVMIALLEHQRPIAAALHLPALDLLYTATEGGGARCHGRPVQVTADPELSRLLIGFGMDASADAGKTAQDAARLARVAQAARNVRATNSLVDFCYAADGRLGGAVNLACKIWDIAAPTLLLREAGGVVSSIDGTPPDFRLDDQAVHRTHTLVAAAPAVHERLLALLR